MKQLIVPILRMALLIICAWYLHTSLKSKKYDQAIVAAMLCSVAYTNIATERKS